MKTKIICLCLSIFLSTSLFSQVGVNNTNPQATLDVTGTPADPALPDGVIPPRISGDQLTSKTAYGVNQTGTIIYVTSASGNPVGPTVNVTAAGYYYFDGTLWQAFTASGTGGVTDNIYTADGTLSENRSVTLNNFDLNFDANTLVISGDNNRVGIGTANPEVNLQILDAANSNPTLRIGNTDGTEGAIELGNFRHGIKRNFAGNVNDVGFFTDFGDLHLSANAEITGELTLTGAGNVGIGTATPIDRLEVMGRVSTSQNLEVGLLGTGDRTSFIDLHATDSGDFESRFFRFGGENGTLLIENKGTGDIRFDVRESGNISDLVVNGETSNIGIGTADPVVKVQILDVENSNPTLRIGNTVGTEGAIELGNALHGMKRNFAGNVNDVGFFTDFGDLHLSADGETEGLFTLTAANNVGIGTNAPTTKLDIVGNARIRTIPVGIATDAIISADANGNIRQRSAAQIVTDGGGVTSNIYTANGALTGNRVLNFNGNNLEFNSPGQNGAANGLSLSQSFITFSGIDGGDGASLFGFQGGLALSASFFGNTVPAGGANPIELFISANTNVGVGTNAPSRKLDVNGNARVRDLPAGAGTDVIVSADGNGVLRQRTAEQVVTDGGGVTSNIYTANGALTGNRVLNLNGNNLQFSSPGQNADANGLNMNQAYIDFSGIDGGDGASLFSFQGGLALSSKFFFNTQPAGGFFPVELFVAENSNVGIGTNIPDTRLHIFQNTVVNRAFLKVEDESSSLITVPTLGNFGFNSLSRAGDIGFIFSTDDDDINEANNGLLIAPHASGNNFGLKIMESGNVGVNVALPTEALDVFGNIAASGTVSAGGVVLTSDIRLKKNVTEVTDALSTINALRPVNYLKRESLQTQDYNRDEYGFIAQELQKIIPTIVETSNNPDKILGVNYLSLIPILTKAIQEQQDELNKKDKLLLDLTKRLEALEAKMN